MHYRHCWLSFIYPYSWVASVFSRRLNSFVIWNWVKNCWLKNILDFFDISSYILVSYALRLHAVYAIQAYRGAYLLLKCVLCSYIRNSVLIKSGNRVVFSGHRQYYISVQYTFLTHKHSQYLHSSMRLLAHIMIHFSFFYLLFAQLFTFHCYWKHALLFELLNHIFFQHAIHIGNSFIVHLS